MAEKYFPFDSVAGDRQYYADDFSKYYAKILSSGILAESGNLNVTPQSLESGMNLEVAPGFAFLNGHIYELTATKVLKLDVGESSDRIDRIVTRLNYNDRVITTIVLKGTASANPVAPAIVRNSTYWDISLATVPVAANTINIGDVVTDTRYDESVCGIVRCPIEKLNADEVWQNVQRDFNTWFEQKKQEMAELDLNGLEMRVTSLEEEVAAISSSTEASVYYGLCGTSDSVTHKAVTCPGFALAAGAKVYVYFDNTNTVTSPTLNVNSTGAKSIRTGSARESVKSYTWPAGSTIEFTYDGTYWIITGSISGTWTPTVNFGSTSATSYTVRNGNYYKVGNIVTLLFNIRVTAPADGEITIGGFSTTCGKASTLYSGGGIMSPVPASKSFVGYYTTGVDKIVPGVSNVSSTLNYIEGASAVSGETYYLYGTISYICA